MSQMLSSSAAAAHAQALAEAQAEAAQAAQAQAIQAQAKAEQAAQALAAQANIPTPSLTAHQPPPVTSARTASFTAPGSSSGAAPVHPMPYPAPPTHSAAYSLEERHHLVAHPWGHLAGQYPYPQHASYMGVQSTDPRSDAVALQQTYAAGMQSYQEAYAVLQNGALTHARSNGGAQSTDCHAQASQHPPVPSSSAPLTALRPHPAKRAASTPPDSSVAISKKVHQSGGPRPMTQSSSSASGTERISAACATGPGSAGVHGSTAKSSVDQRQVSSSTSAPSSDVQSPSAVTTARMPGTEDSAMDRAAKIAAAKTERRQEALRKFKVKKQFRSFEKKILYDSRKQLAEQRPRVQGKFMRVDKSKEANKSSTASISTRCDLRFKLALCVDVLTELSCLCTKCFTMFLRK